jgi:transketolase
MVPGEPPEAGLLAMVTSPPPETFQPTWLARLERLMDLMPGDEKHDPAARSTLDVLWVLYDRVLRYDASRPDWEGRDRFLLSKGHGPVALYAILADKGFFPVDWLPDFLDWDGRLGGHPDRNLVPGVEISTGSLGHGVPMAVGVALALRAKRSDRRVFVLLGDGEANEGSVWEALLLAGNLKLDNLTAILVDNHSSSRDLGDMAAKFAAFGWQPFHVVASNHDALEAALRHCEPGRPTGVVVDWREAG